jgi:hypothetical protein
MSSLGRSCPQEQGQASRFALGMRESSGLPPYDRCSSDGGVSSALSQMLACRAKHHSAVRTRDFPSSSIATLLISGHRRSQSRVLGSAPLRWLTVATRM